MRLILWDLDGTLLRAGSVASEVFDDAVADVVGIDPRGHDVRMSGKTDPQIAEEILARAGIQGNAAHAHVPAILERLAVRLAANTERIQREGRAMPGAHTLLAALDECPGLHQSVLTGNVAANARLKTAALGLDRWLDWDVGAFGSDHADRRKLVAVARARAGAALGSPPDLVWVVGDTPNDLAGARAGGARCALVATGRFARCHLEELGADAVVDDLTDTDALVDLLTGRDRPTSGPGGQR